MFILEYKDGVKPAELSPKAKANMERCANFLVEMIEKYGKEVLEEIEAEEEVPDYSWAGEYLPIINSWHNSHRGDYSEGYDLIYLNDDDFPELCLFCDDGANSGIDIYTYQNKTTSHVELEGGGTAGSDITCFGRQGQTDAYSERTGFYLRGGGMMGNEYYTGYILDGSTLKVVMNYNNIYDISDETVSYDLWYIKKDGTEFKTGGDEQIPIEENEYMAEIGNEYGFKINELKSLLDLEKHMSYEEITAELKNLLKEATAEKY